VPNKTAQQVREELIKIKGIGNWTIDIYLMFCLQAPDLLPLDIAVVNTINELLNILYDKRDGNSVRVYILCTKKRNRTVVY
jgi:DNA-3-methyladenine glycosylase II